MVRILTILTLALSAACNSNLDVKVAQVGPSEEGLGLGLKIVLEHPVVNTGSVVVSWEDETTAPVHYNLAVATDSECLEVTTRYGDLTDRNQAVTIVDDGAYHLCLEAVSSSGSKQSAENNGLSLTVDRELP